MALDPVSLARGLIDIDSTTGREGEAGVWLSRLLRDLGYQVVEHPVSDGRVNVFARLDAPPQVVLSTHIDCVPPFFPSREERGLLFGRGSCDAKGILAAQVVAAERLRARGESRIGLLFVVGEERGSDGARVADRHAPPGVRYLINGEPTDNRLGSATRGVLRLRLRAAGRAARSAFPELGDSAIDKLLDALMVIRGVPLPDDPLLGRTHYTVGFIEGGVASNVVSPLASAELLFRTVGDAEAVRTALAVVEGLVTRRRMCPCSAAGASRSSLDPAPFTWRTRTRNPAPSTSCTPPSGSTKPLWHDCARPGRSGTSRTLHWPIGEPHRGPDPVRLQPANRVRAGRQQR